MSESSYDQIVEETIAGQVPEEVPFQPEPAMYDENGDEIEWVYNDPEEYEQPVQELAPADLELIHQLNNVVTPEAYQKLAQDVTGMAGLLSNTPGAIAYRAQEAAALDTQIQRGFELMDRQLDGIAESEGTKIVDHTAVRVLAEKLYQKANNADAREGLPYDPDANQEWAMRQAVKEATGNRTYSDVVSKYVRTTGGERVEPGTRRKWA